MSIPQLNGTQGATPVGMGLMQEALDTASLLVKKARAGESAAEAKDFAAAVLSLAQVVTLLDPARDTQGVPLSHHAAMQDRKAEHELEREKERAKAQAPTPARKTVNVGRDAQGRAASYTVEDS